MTNSAGDTTVKPNHGTTVDGSKPLSRVELEESEGLPKVTMRCRDQVRMSELANVWVPIGEGHVNNGTNLGQFRVLNLSIS